MLLAVRFTRLSAFYSDRIVMETGGMFIEKLKRYIRVF